MDVQEEISDAKGARLAPKRQCRDAQPADLIGAGLVIDVLHVGFSKEFGNERETWKAE